MIVQDAKTKCFTLQTPHSCYQMQVGEDGRLYHLHYGAPQAQSAAPAVLLPMYEPGWAPDRRPLEYSANGVGDFRIPAAQARTADGAQALDFRFEKAEITPGKYTLPELPTFGGDENEVQTLRVTLRDASGLCVTLLYGVYETLDMITRAAVFENAGAAPVHLLQAASFCLDFAARPLDLITFNGSWGAERTPERAPLRSGVQSVGSVRGISSHDHNPTLILCTPDATEDTGECWGAALVYSGNFLAQVEKHYNGVRCVMGIHPAHFDWALQPGQRFAAPEATLVYSANGFAGMSGSYHTAMRRHLLRRPAAPRPVLINSWEACYFDFDEARLLRLAEAAKQTGMDLFVLDDGWFKGRNDDTTSLGDWTADRKKLPGGIPGLCRKINALGMDFGIWVEPEAVNPDSDLYRAHPDWALQIPGRDTFELRHQYTLDFSRAEVVDAIWQQLDALLSSCPIRYVKWDMNRSLADVYSTALPAARQGEVYHRYVLGVYELQRRLVTAYPDVLLENCSSGGGRFDCGMLAYSPQIWCSDNTDAADRCMIQYGTSFFYPPSTMGAHYSESPNQYTRRTACAAARTAAAISGSFGFELDLTKCSETEKESLRPWIDAFRQYDELLQNGSYYRLASPLTAGRGSAWMFVSQDGAEALVFAVGSVLDNPAQRTLRLKGLPAGQYRLDNGECCTAEYLQNTGLNLPETRDDVPAEMWHLCRC